MLMMQVYKSGKEFIACFTRSYVVDQSAHTFNCLEMSMLRLMINIRLGLHRSDGLLSHDASLDWKLDVNNFYVSAAFQCVTVVCSCDQQKVMNNSVEFRRKKLYLKKGFSRTDVDDEPSMTSQQRKYSLRENWLSGHYYVNESHKRHFTITILHFTIANAKVLFVFERFLRSSSSHKLSFGAWNLSLIFFFFRRSPNRVR